VALLRQCSPAAAGAAAPLGPASRPWWVLWSALAGLFAVNVNFTIVAVALPGIADDLHTHTSTVTWVVTGPLLAFGVAAPILGKAGDVFGHRRLYLTGLGIAFVAALLTAVAPTAGLLIAARLLGAVSGAATGSAGTAMIFSVFAPHDRVKAMGFWSLVAAGGPVIGVVIGGPVVEAVGWRWVFAGQAPLIVVALALGLAVLPRSAGGARRRLDWPGALLLAGAVTGLLLALNRGPVMGWQNPLVLGGFALAPALALAFVRVERQAAEPLIPLDYFRRRNFVFPVGAMAFSQFAYMGGFILAPLLLGGPLFGYGEARIGFVMLPRPLAFSLVAPVAGYVAVRVGERFTAVGGTLAVAVSMAVFALVGHGDVGLVVVALTLSGIGLGMATPSLVSSVANSVDEADFGVAGASSQLLTQVGVVAGIQLMQTVQEAWDSFAAAYLLGGAVALVGVTCAAFVRSARRDESALAGALEPPGIQVAPTP
jgi:MFS family permease